MASSACSQKTTKRYDCVRHFAAYLVDHHSLHGSDVAIIGTVNSRSLDLVTADERGCLASVVYSCFHLWPPVSHCCFNLQRPIWCHCTKVNRWRVPNGTVPRECVRGTQHDQ